MSQTPRRIAILVELPKGEKIEIVALRRMLKCLLRSFGIKCLAVAKPEETKTFEGEAGK